MITPIPKKGSLTEIKNYRPISLLCVLSKVLERIIYNKVIEFIRPKLSELQFGFLKNRSALQQLLAAFALMHNALDNRHTMNALYLDFCKAFNTVPHYELLGSRNWQIGITGLLWKLFSNYLSNRSHFVCYNGCNSSILPVLSGVPQGSILGLDLNNNESSSLLSNSVVVIMAEEHVQCIKTHINSYGLMGILRAHCIWLLQGAMGSHASG